jgi:hypothetical protein
MRVVAEQQQPKGLVTGLKTGARRFLQVRMRSSGKKLIVGTCIKPILLSRTLAMLTGLLLLLHLRAVALLQRYDPVTTGLGSLLVTGYCVVAHQQSVGEALNIAACATVLGMVGTASQRLTQCCAALACRPFHKHLMQADRMRHTSGATKRIVLAHGVDA